MVDDDVLLEPDFLTTANLFMQENPEVWAAGGIIDPLPESPLPTNSSKHLSKLAIRQFGNEILISNKENYSGDFLMYPPFAPVGAGMVLRKELADSYLNQTTKTPPLPDRTGNNLSSGGDCEIVCLALINKKLVAYVPNLKLKHYLPNSRFRVSYLARIAYAISRSWVLVLGKYNSSPWPPIRPWTAPLRKFKALIKSQPWKGKEEFIKWREMCGHIDGQVDLYKFIKQNNCPRKVNFFTPGRLLYLLYYRPRAWFNHLKQIGPINYLRKIFGQLAMERSIHSIKPEIRQPKESAIGLHILTGADYWYQTIWCLHSFFKQTNQIYPITFYDDGSLKFKHKWNLARLFPSAKMQRKTEIDGRIESALPENEFPTLRAHRLMYPHLKKIIDIHCGSSGWKLVLDSDMLFWKNPKELLEWLENPTEPIHLKDIKNSYGYSLQAMSDLTQHQIPEKVNVGLIGLNSSSIDWKKIEFWCSSLLKIYGSHYCLEQGLTAMLLSEIPHFFLPSETYIVGPSKENLEDGSSILHHYVGDSKFLYFSEAWKKFAL